MILEINTHTQLVHIYILGCKFRAKQYKKRAPVYMKAYTKQPTYLQLVVEYCHPSPSSQNLRAPANTGITGTHTLLFVGLRRTQVQTGEEHWDYEGCERTIWERRM